MVLEPDISHVSDTGHRRIWTSWHRCGMPSCMRTTLNIDDEILEAAKSIADERSVSVGAVLSDLARRGLQPTDAGRRKSREFPVFGVSNDGTVLTLDRVKRHEDGP